MRLTLLLRVIPTVDAIYVVNQNTKSTLTEMTHYLFPNYNKSVEFFYFVHIFILHIYIFI